MRKASSIFEFDWAEGRGLDRHLTEWQERVGPNPLLILLEISQALYSAFVELRKIHKIQTQFHPCEHSFFQLRFELFSHNHFLSISVTRVTKILYMGWPHLKERIFEKHGNLIERLTRYRNSLEHQTEIGRQKTPPQFLNNLTDRGFESDGVRVDYVEVQQLLNDVMSEVEKATSRGT